MIKPQHLAILAAILVALVGLNMFLARSHENSTGQSATEVLLPADLGELTTGRLTLTYGEGDPQVVLVKGPRGWFLESHHGAAADANRVATLLRDLSGAAGEFRSEGGDILGDYGLDPAGCVTVRGYDASGAEIYALHLGDSPQGFPGQFARRSESDRVFVTQKSLLAGMGIYGGPDTPRARHFLQLEAVKEEGLAIDAVVVTDGEQVLDLKKAFASDEPGADAPAGTPPTVDRGVWEWLEAGQPATDLAKTKLDAILNTCVAIRATDVADPEVDPAVYGLADPGRTVLMTRQDGSTLQLSFGSSREAQGDVTAGTYMRVAGDETIWVVTDYTLKNIFKDREELTED